MLTLEHVQKTIARYSFPPKMTMKAYMIGALDGDMINLRLRHLVPDVNDPETIVEVKSEVLLAPEGTDDRLLRIMIEDQVRTAAQHEVDEYLKLDGVHVVDPHPELKEKTC